MKLSSHLVLALAALVPCYAACSGAPASDGSSGVDLSEGSPGQFADGGAGPAADGGSEGGKGSDGGTSACDVGAGRPSVIRSTFGTAPWLMVHYAGKLYSGEEGGTISVLSVNGGAPATINPLFAYRFQELFVNAAGIYFRDTQLVHMSLLGTNEQLIDTGWETPAYMDQWGGYRYHHGTAVDNSDSTVTALTTYGARGDGVIGALAPYMAADQHYVYLTSSYEPVGEKSQMALTRFPRSLDVSAQLDLFSVEGESPGPLVLDATRVYLATYRRLVSVGKDGMGLRVISTATGIRKIAVDSLDVYWVDGKNIMRAPKDGSGAPTKAFQACEGIDNITASDGQGVYFTSHSGKNHTIWKLTR